MLIGRGYGTMRISFTREEAEQLVAMVQDAIHEGTDPEKSALSV